MIKAVIFDMDGVIVDTEPIYEKVNKDFYAKYGIDMEKIDTEKYIGVNLIETWEDLLNNFELKSEYADYSLEDIIEDHVHSYYKGLESSEELKLMPGIIDWFKFLKENNYKLIIASSSYEPIIEYIIQEFKLDDFFVGYADGNEVENGKPAPDIFIKAAEKLGLKNEECLVIEDSEHGITGAKKAGSKVIGFKQREDAEQDLSEADIVIEEFNRKYLNDIFA